MGGGSRKSGGWAAFDRDHRRVWLVDDAFDPFPPLRSANSNNGNGHGNGNVSSSSPRPNNNIPTVSAQSHTKNQTSSLPTTSTSTANTSIVNTKSQPKHHSPSPSPSPSASPHVCDSSGACFKSVPIEPEWEDDDDDDVYLTHRKEALRTMRSASRHSKAATNAFVRGDHFSAHQHSLEAHHNYSHAQTLHSKAASQILSARNPQNDACNLDLHGLHAAEALHFLEQHLHRIETRFLSKLEPSPSSPRHKRSTSLQVITGVGNHSRGQASLPTAVRGFLNENGYHFEDLKPGVITIRLKFRISS